MKLKVKSLRGAPPPVIVQVIVDNILTLHSLGVALKRLGKGHHDL